MAKDFGKGFSSGPREMHDAVCSECGTSCQVPFKPTDGKPVYCRECYSKRRPKRF
jgi:CxxC-x17-CxxC domain-containing protein